MSSFVNLMDIIYPVGSIYITTDSTSPSEFIGGTWEKIENCLLAASGNIYNSSGKYAGSDMIDSSAVPNHQHDISGWNSAQATYSNAGFWNTNSSSGSLLQLLSFGGDQAGGDTGWSLRAKDIHRINSNGQPTEQQKHIPYHYSVDVYRRTA